MLKNNNEIIAETDEDLQLQAGMKLDLNERQCLLLIACSLLILSGLNLI